MTESRTTWGLFRMSPDSLPGEGKLLFIDTDRKDLAGRARPLNAQQKKAAFTKRNGYPRYRFQVRSVRLS